MLFTYVVCENEGKEPYVIITNCDSEEERIEVPECFHGIPVKEIGKYAFHGKHMKKVQLPKTVDTVGSHAFYDCRQLEEITISDYLVEVGDGAFKNCRMLNVIEIYVFQERYTCLKNLLSEMNQQIICKLHRKKEEVELLFPSYLHNYQENTMARIINQETYGAGAHYREAITKDGIVYKEYDSRFYLATNVEKEEVLYGIALLRLCYPCELGEPYKEQYVTFLKEHWIPMIQWLLKTEQKEKIKWLGQYEGTSKEDMKVLLEQLQQAEEIELLSEMMQMNQQRFGQKKKSFAL